MSDVPAQAQPAPVSAPARSAVVANWKGEAGPASFYGTRHNGHRAADGSVFNQFGLTAAHPWLPFGTKVKVTSVSTGRSVIVTITDRMRARHVILDLSYGAAKELGMIREGVGRVKLEPV